MQKNLMQMIGRGIVLFLPVFLSGQIVIDYNEIPHINGTRWTKNIAYEQTVSLGSAGGPQSWTFTSQPMGADSCTNTVVSVASTPFHDSFPSANLSYMQVDGPDSAFMYMRLVSSYISTLGIAGQDSSGGIFIIYDPVDTNTLPEHYGDYRHYRMGWTVIIDATTYAQYWKHGWELINAYGTVTVPYGSFPCLRYILYDTLVQTIYYNSVPVYSDTTAKIAHQFVAENRSGVVCVASHDGETNPYFTSAATLERLTYFYTGVEEGAGWAAKPNSEKIVEVSPNPFTDEITFTCHQPGRLEIRDAVGRVVKSFQLPTTCSILPAVVWNGTNDLGMKLPAGVYFYTLENDGQRAAGKVLLVK